MGKSANFLNQHFVAFDAFFAEMQGLFSVRHTLLPLPPTLVMPLDVNNTHGKGKALKYIFSLRLSKL